jgi:hypothetical protein
MYSWRIISKKTPKTKPYTSGNTYSNKKISKSIISSSFLPKT